MVIALSWVALDAVSEPAMVRKPSETAFKSADNNSCTASYGKKWCQQFGAKKTPNLQQIKWSPLISNTILDIGAYINKGFNTK